MKGRRGPGAVWSGRTRRLALLAVAAALPWGLSACPLPQPLAEVSRVDGGTFAPPRIVGDSAVPPESVIRVSRTCPTRPQFSLQLQVDDPDTNELVEARWFIDYDPTTNVGITRDDIIPGTGDPSVTVRPIAPFVYVVPDPDPANTAHVVEVVISNGFAPPGDLSVPLPNRMPAEGFETQLFRWVFQYTDTSGRCQSP